MPTAAVPQSVARAALQQFAAEAVPKGAVAVPAAQAAPQPIVGATVENKTLQVARTLPRVRFRCWRRVKLRCG